MNRHRIVLNQPPLDDLVNTFCAATYLEALEIEKHNFPPMARDIFIEQAALCGLVGYRWFFSPLWLQKIISWQDKQTGCYKLEHLLNNQTAANSTKSSNATNVRVKREERMLRDGCLSHYTAVAAGALVMYVRYIAEYAQMIFEGGQLATNNNYPNL